MILAVALFATVTATSPIATSPPPPTLCLGDTCRVVGDAQIQVAPAEVPRPFVWISADGTRVIAGVIPAAETILPLNDEQRVPHKVNVVASDGARAIALSYSLHCGSNEWKWSQPSLPRAAFEVVHPKGPCALEIRSDGYRTGEQALNDAVADTVYLHRLPVISGTITDAKLQTPIARAEVLFPNGKTLALSNADGRFRAVIDQAWPSEIRVEAEGRAMRIVSVPKVVADTHLSIALSTGGTIALALEPPLGQEELQWELRRVVDRFKDEVVRIGDIAAGETQLTIAGLEAALYRVVLKGKGPLQRFARSIEVSDGQTVEATLRIEPARLEVKVTRTGQPLGDTELELIFDQGLWRSKVSVDDRGEAAEEIWQRGRYIAAFQIWSESKDLDTDGTIRWELTVPERGIRGRITEAVTGQAVMKANVRLDASFGMTSTTTEADGTFEFKTLPTGDYSLIVEANGHRPFRTPKRTLTEETKIEVLDVVLQASAGRAMRAVTTLGIPVGSALVFVSSRSGTRSAGLTDADGRALLPIEVNESGSLFVVPRSGSLGVARFGPAAESDDGRLDVVVPDGSASLELHTETTDGEPLGGVLYMMRVNGVRVPMEVKEAMQKTGVALSTDANGRAVLAHMPPGRYEIWPLASRADYVAVMAAIPPPAPVNVVLTSGNQIATLTFKPKTDGAGSE